MNERLEPEIGHRSVYRSDVRQRVLSREHDAFDAQVPHHRGTRRVVDGHLRRSVNLERRVDLADELHEPEILHDHGVYAAIDRLPQVFERVNKLGRLDEDVEREVDALPMLVREEACLLNFIEGELRALVAGVEAIGPEIHGVGPVRDRGSDGVERAGGREELGNSAADHK